MFVCKMTINKAVKLSFINCFLLLYYSLFHHTRVDQGILIISQKVLSIFRGLLRRQHNIDHQSESILNELRNDPAQQTTTNFKRRVSVHLTQPRLTRLIHQKIQTKYLKINPLSCTDQSCISNCVANVPCYLLHLGQDLIIEVESCMVETVLIKLTVRKFVSRLKFVIIWQIFLHCVIGEVYSLRNLLGCELLRSCANVALLIPIKFETSTHLHTQHIATNIKFALLIKKWRDVLLKQKCAFL
jgi:hypothetical protein